MAGGRQEEREPTVERRFASRTNRNKPRGTGDFYFVQQDDPVSTAVDRDLGDTSRNEL